MKPIRYNVAIVNSGRRRIVVRNVSRWTARFWADEFNRVCQQMGKNARAAVVRKGGGA